jgi:hypothetical protein
MNNKTAELISSLLEILVLLVTMFVVPLIRSRLKAGKVRDAVETITLIASNVVAETANNVRDLKDPQKPGTWDKETAQLVLNQAITAVKSQARPAYEELLAHMGGDRSKVDELVKTAVEASVERGRKSE